MSITLIITAIIFAIIILVFINLVGRPVPKGVDKQYFQNEWGDIIELAKEQKTKPMSIINADRLLDEALRSIGFSGNTMAERLVSAKQHLRDRNSVWGAHRLRNKIVHESLHEPSDKEIQNALKGYYQAFKDLRVM